MTQNHAPLAECLGRALEKKGQSIEGVAERTKVPPATIRALLGSREPAVLPQRAYLRGHVAIIARDLDVDVDAMLGQFDLEHPRDPPAAPVDNSRFHPALITVAAGLGCLAIIAVILAFVR